MANKKSRKSSKSSSVIILLLVVAIGAVLWKFWIQPNVKTDNKPENTATATATVTATGEATAAPTATVEPEEGIFCEYNGEKIPVYAGSPKYELNENEPYFTETEKNTVVCYETYPDLDSLGRCLSCISCVGREIMPTEERGSIGSVKPTGWHTYRAKGVDGGYLYNRCHLLGFQLTGENANKRNLITGTRYMNIAGMLDLENSVAQYVKDTDNHVIYRVTPVFIDSELLARGVVMEAWSVEDEGGGICFCWFVYNVQPDFVLNYADGTVISGEYTTYEIK